MRDSLLVYRSPSPLLVRVSGGVSVADNPFSREASVRVGPDGRVYHAWTDTPGVRITSLDGRRAGGFALRAEGREVTPDDVECAIRRLRAAEHRLSRAPGGGGAPRWPVLAAPRGQPSEWLVYHPDGRFAASAVLPPGTDVMRVEGGHGGFPGSRVREHGSAPAPLPRLIVQTSAPLQGFWNTDAAGPE